VVLKPGMVSKVCAMPDQREPGTPVKNILLGSMCIINYMDQHTLDKYFSTHWHSNIDQYEYSGWALLQKIKLERKCTRCRMWYQSVPWTHCQFDRN
jgi:hypothetical protein